MERFLAPFPPASSLIARLFVHESLVHALLIAVGVSVAGAYLEPRLGATKLTAVFVLGALIGLLGSAESRGLGGGVMALYGALLFDLARRRASASMFGPLVAPMLLHGAVQSLVPGDYALQHGAGLVVGAVLARLLSAGRTAPTE